MTHTGATIFSGGGGADIGMQNAGVDVRWGIEVDDEIASVARDNGLPIKTGDVTEVSPETMERVDILHASPPCPNFSVAKADRKESDEDVSLARSVTKFVDGLQPKLFTLENVWGYRRSRSWKLIREYFQRNDYAWNAWRLNSADYGVPQTRKRLIVAARRLGPRPSKPTPTHAENPSSTGLFGDEKKEWVGWYESVKDLIPDLPDTELADWQKERLPDDLLESTIIDTHATARGDCRTLDEPTKTVAADPLGGCKRAVLVHGSSTRVFPRRENDEPTFSVIANGNTRSEGANVPRAILVSHCTVAGGRNPRRQSDGPSFTAKPNDGEGRLKAVIQGRRRRVIEITPRCLARFQTIPDWYDLPDAKTLACRVVGNAVPPLLLQKCLSHWISNH